MVFLTPSMSSLSDRVTKCFVPHLYLTTSTRCKWGRRFRRGNRTFSSKPIFLNSRGSEKTKAPLLIPRKLREKAGVLITTYWKGPQANKVSNTVITVVTAHVRAKVIVSHGWWQSRTHHAVIACQVLSLSVMFTGMLRLPQLCLMRERLTNSFAQGQTSYRLGVCTQ